MLYQITASIWLAHRERIYWGIYGGFGKVDLTYNLVLCPYTGPGQSYYLT
ncbi:hypothetical protein MOMUL_29700 [Moorella mulderi DSM 14980]|uniref:Uncharacterized protein n=1 Tax=Moorella mulderi DSM 14980 TaxID=1122241 RepID=A0A151ASR1_9FIRM|nr:hypothetical protein MOMUL_29700 [Moorella mulderi DSM 14980]